MFLGVAMFLSLSAETVVFTQPVMDLFGTRENAVSDQKCPILNDLPTNGLQETQSSFCKVAEFVVKKAKEN